MDAAMIKKQAVKFVQSRSALLTVFALTVLNLLLEVFEVGFYFLYSAFVPQIIYLLLIRDLGPFDLGLVLALAVTSIYLVCWALSKGRRVFILVAMILFALDTAARLVFFFLYVWDWGVDIWIMIELAFSAMILFSLIGGTIAWAKLRNVTSDELHAVQEEVTQAEQTDAVRSVLKSTPDQGDNSPPKE